MTTRHEQLEQLTAYLDGELDDTGRRSVEALLEGDPEARNLLDGLRQTSELVASLPRGTAPPDLASSVTARLERRELLGGTDRPQAGKAVRSVSWVNRLAIAASIGLVCTAGWLGWDRMSRTQETPRLASRIETPSNTSVISSEKGVEDGAGTLAGEAVVSARGRRTAVLDSAPPTIANEAQSNPTVMRAGIDRPAEGVFTKSEESDVGDSSAERTMLALATDDLESQLGRKVVSNDGLRQVRFSSVGNSVEVLTNEPTQRAMAKAVTDYAAFNRLPIVPEQKLPEPITPTQAFVLQGEPNTNYRPAADEDEKVFLIYVPEENLPDLMHNLNQAAAGSAGNLSVVANGQAVKDLNAAVPLVESTRRRGGRFGFKQPAGLTARREVGLPVNGAATTNARGWTDAGSAGGDHKDAVPAAPREPVRHRTVMKKSVRDSDEDEPADKYAELGEKTGPAGGSYVEDESKGGVAVRTVPADRADSRKSGNAGRFVDTTQPTDRESLGLTGESFEVVRKTPASGKQWGGGRADSRQFVALTLSLRSVRGLDARAYQSAPKAGPTTQTTQPNADRATTRDTPRGG